MNIIFIFTTLAFFLWVLRNALFWVALWQIKEYRFDRLFVHLKETVQGRSLLFGSFSNIKWLVIFIYSIVIFNDKLILPYEFLVAILFFYQALTVYKEVFAESLKRPVLTSKALFLIIATLFFLFLFYSFPFFDKFVWLLLLDRLTPFIIAFFVFLLSFPTELYRDWQVRQAVKKIRGSKKLLVIGVTGSYGKSSTKEFIAQVLAEKFKVVKTPGTNNTSLGIAKTILRDLKKDTQIFVVEMGAYKKGEISELCQIVKPQIGVLTGISEQHLSLFGSLGNILEGKYELIRSLPKKGGLAVFNGNNDLIKKLFQKTKIKKMIYSFTGESDVGVSNFKVNKLNIKFRVSLGRKSSEILANLLGRHNVENLLAAILIGDYLGMKLSEIKEAIKKIDYLPLTMKPSKTRQGAILVDDTFNASPDAVLAAIEYLKIFRGKRILILQPMIELGREAPERHYEVGVASGKFLTRIFLTNQNFIGEILRGVRESGRGEDFIEVAPAEQIASSIEKQIGKGDVVVFEGKESAKALKLLITNY